MTHRPLVFADLDDTLFQTARKMAEAPSEERRAAVATNGHHSYMTAAQASLFGWLAGSAELVPVTARSTEALSRVALGFEGHRVAANGAVILLPCGSPDPDWQARIAAISAEAAPRLAALDARAAACNRTGRLRHWIVSEAGAPIYACVKSNGPDTWLDDADAALAELAGDALLRHRNGNNLSFTPRGISKRLAVDHLIGRLAPDGARPVIGFGDSLTDLPFMRACSWLMIPAGSQIDRDGMRA